MSYLLDTNVISRCHKKSIPAALENWLRKHEDECFISAVTIAEMRFGVDLAEVSHRKILARRVGETETHFAEAIEPVTLDSLLEWKKVFAFLKKSRRTIACEDALIAAQCLAGGHTLVTENTKDFELLKPLGLKIENPFRA